VARGGSVQADIQFNFRDSDSAILKLDALAAADTVAFAGRRAAARRLTAQASPLAATARPA
jgi:hypothetical protein